MRRIMWLQKRLLWCAVVAVTQVFINQGLEAATFEFSSPSSKLVLGDYNGGATPVTSFFKNTSRSKLIGFDQQSIVRGNSQANTFSNAWTTSLGVQTVSGTLGALTKDLLVTTSEAATSGSASLRGTSNWVSNQANDFGSAMLGRQLRGTSNWAASQVADFGSANVGARLRGTSNWVSNQANDFGSAMLGRQLRGTSNWAASQVADFGSANVGARLRGTSNWVSNQANDFGSAMLGRQLRGTSNWAASQVSDLGSANVGARLRGTSNWVSNQANDFGSAILGRQLRGTSNWAASQVSDLGSANVGARLRGTSNWVSNQANDFGSAMLGSQLRTTSNSINRYVPLVVANSNWVNANGGLVRTTSSAVVNLNNTSSSLLARTTSNALNKYLPVMVGNSNWVNANGGLVRTNSNSVNAQWPILRTTSHSVNVNVPLLMATSNAVNRYVPVVVGTSNWVSAKDLLVRTSSNAVNSVNAAQNATQGHLDAFLGATGTGSYVAAGMYVRTTSNWVNQQLNAFGSSTLGMQLRGTSNWVNRQAADLGNAGVGMYLRTTSNWVNQQFQALGDSNLGQHVRTTTNWLDRQRVDFGVGNLGLQLRGTSNAVNRYVPVVVGNSNFLRTTSNLLVVTNRVANNALNISSKAATDIVGIQQASANNAVSFTSTSTAAFSYSLTDTAAQVNAIAWHPLGNAIAVASNGINNGGHGGVNAMSVRYFNAAFSRLAAPYNQGGTNQDIDPNYVVSTLAWNASGSRLAVGANSYTGSPQGRVYVYYYYNYDNSYLYRYSYNQSAMINLANANIKQIAFSNNGQYLAIVGKSIDNSTNQVQIYSMGNYYDYYNNSNLVASYSYQADANASVNSVSWHPTDGLIAIGGLKSSSKPTVDVLKFDGSSLSSVLSQGRLYSTDTADYVKTVAWDVTGAYLAVGGTTPTAQGKIFEFVDNSSLVFTCTLASAREPNEPFNALAWSRDGNYITAAHRGYDLYSFKNVTTGSSLTPVDGRAGFANVANDVKWTIDGKYFALAGKNLTGSGVDMVLYSMNTDLVVNNGSGDVSLGSALSGTSQWVVNQVAAYGANTIGLGLRTTSNAMNRYASGQTNDPDLVRTTSNWVAKQYSDFGASTLGMQLRGTSNWAANQVSDFGVASMGVRLRGTSNWANRQAEDLGNAGVGMYLRTTSNWVNQQFNAFGASTLGMQLRGTSNWAANQVSDFGVASMGVRLRGTSNWANRQAEDLGNAGVGMYLRTTSNWVNEQFNAFGASTLGMQLRGTSNWANRQAVDLGNAGVGMYLRVSSNWINRQAVDLGGADGSNSQVGLYLRATSNSAVLGHRRLDGHDADLHSIHADLATIDVGVPHYDIYGAGYDQTFDMFIASENLLRFHASTTLNGNGHLINFARGRAGIMQLDARVQVMTTNVVLHDFTDIAIHAAASSRLTFGRGTVIELPTDTALTRNWVCAGDVVIRGFGSKLNLAGYTITLESGTLTFEDVVLAGVETGSIICRRDDASIRMRDVRVNLAGATDFPTGSLLIDRSVTIAGQNAFVYGSDKPLSIGSNSALMLDSNTVFTYAPATANRDLIEMADETSILHLKGCVLVSTTTGMRLRHGTLLVESNNNIDNTGATSLSEAVTFGDGVADNDLHLEFLPGATLNTVGGILNYQNVNG